MNVFKIIFSALLLTTLTTNADAQIKDWLNKKKEEAKQKVNNKIDQKSSEGLDKVIDAPETAIKKKKEKKANKTAVNDAMLENNSADGGGTTAQQSNTTETVEVTNEIPNENGATVIQTNITCEAGKKNILKVLKKQEGVSKVDINTKNGEINIEYSSDGISYTKLIALINENGFEADGNPSTSKKNGCK